MAPRLFSGAAPEQVARDLMPLLEFTDEGMALEEVQRLVDTHLAPHLLDYGHPGFQSMFNTRSEAGALLGAQIGLVHNQGVTNWQVSPGGAMLEELCGRALCRLFGLHEQADATFMYSGTYANQEALYLALHRHAEGCGFDLAQEGLAGFSAPHRLVILASADGHFSLRHAVRMLGLGERSLISVPVDGRRRLDTDALREVIQDLGGSRDVVCMVATAGTTSTGAIDPIADMAELCRESGAWLHVDGAYGYAYKLVPEWRTRFAGDEFADSISWDPHKQLGIPIPNSLLFVRQAGDFSRMALYSGYFNRADDPYPNPGLKSPPSTRPMAALPLITSLRHRGLRRVVEDLRAPLEAMAALADQVAALPDVQICHLPDTGILCLRVTPPGLTVDKTDHLQRTIHGRILADGQRSVSLTTLDGRPVLRLVAVSPELSASALIETVIHLRTLAYGLRDS